MRRDGGLESCPAGSATLFRSRYALTSPGGAAGGQATHRRPWLRPGPLRLRRSSPLLRLRAL